MTGRHRRRHAGAAVGSVIVVLLLVALFGLGGRGEGDPAGRPESLHRNTPHATTSDRASTTVTADTGPRLPDLGGALPSAAAVLAVLLVVVGLVATAAMPPLAARPIPVRAGRGPPRRRA